MKVFRISCAVLLVFSVLFTVFYGASKITEEKNPVSGQEYKAIISLWNIDTFEGGISSRKQFLLKTAIDYEKKNKGVLVMVSTHTVKSAEENIKNGVFPDIISFGNGLSFYGASKMDIKSNFSGGYIGDDLYAVPWAKGGYFLIGNTKLVKTCSLQNADNITVSKGEYTQPVLAMLLEGIKPKSIEIKSCKEAYLRFAEGKTPYLLGTQRDINRLNNRGINYDAIPLQEFNDLYQYVSITSTDQVKRFYAEEFVKYLLSEKVQKRLTEIGLFSLDYNLSYENALAKMDSVKQKYTISVFTDKLVLEEISSLSVKAIGGEEEAVIKLKNMII